MTLTQRIAEASSPYDTRRRPLQLVGWRVERLQDFIHGEDSRIDYSSSGGSHLLGQAGTEVILRLETHCF